MERYKNRDVTEADAKRIAEFKELIIVDAEAKHLQKVLSEIYRNYTRLLVQHPDMISTSTDDELCYLGMIIDVLE